VATPTALTEARTLATRAAGLPPARIIRKFAEHGGPSQAVLIAWNALTAVFPIALALAAIGGFVLTRAGITPQTLAERMGGFFPTDLGTQQALIEGMSSLQHQTGLFAILALVGFLWTGSGLFGAMEEAFGVVFQTPTRPFLKQKLMAVAMMGLFAVLALLAVGTSALLPLLSDIPGIPISLTKGATGYVVQVAIGVVSGFVLFFAIYAIVPNRRQRLSRVVPGALFAGIAFELLSQLWPFYIKLNQGGFNRFGSQFALLFILLAFFYLLGLITVLGADIIAVLDPPEPARQRQPDQTELASRPRKPIGRLKRTALGAAALVIGIAVGRRRSRA
jgi:membrane protein